MLLALSVADYGVLGLYLVAMLLVGVYFSREQHSSGDFFLAGRSMGWFPVGLSILATLLSALSYTGIPGESYYAGMQFFLMVVGVWLTLPIMLVLIIPLYRGLELVSIYEYLEMRFDSTTRFVSSLIFVLWRLLWMGGVLYAPCKVMVIAAGIDMPLWLMMVILGLVSTAYTFLGGMKAVIWTDVIQSLIMFAGLVMIIGSVWWQMEGGPPQVWQVAEQFGRATFAKLPAAQTGDGGSYWAAFWGTRWNLWGILPHFFFAMLSFYVADQITVQRYLTTRDTREARRSYLLNCFGVTFMVTSLAYVGVCLFAFYQQHPQAMRPIWVIDVDHQSLGHEPGGAEMLAGADKKPLVDWETGRRLDPIQFDPQAAEELIAQGVLLTPNSKEPFASLEDVVDPETGKMDIDRLAMRSRGEIVLNKKAQDELMPRFITRQLGIGVAGLILAALLAASMSSIDSGLNSVTTLLIYDFYRGRGIGRGLLARLLGKSPDQLDESDELHLGRWLVLIIGIAATVFSLLVSQAASVFDLMLKVINTVGAPLLAVFLLGMLTRRCTARAALVSLIGGTLLTLWLSFGSDWAAKLNAPWIWPLVRLDSSWAVTFGTLGTFALGMLLSLFLGQPKPPQELAGLVLGLGRLGHRPADEDEESVSVDLSDLDRQMQRDKKRWK